MRSSGAGVGMVCEYNVLPTELPYRRSMNKRDAIPTCQPFLQACCVLAQSVGPRHETSSGPTLRV